LFTGSSVASHSGNEPPPGSQSRMMRLPSNVNAAEWKRLLAPRQPCAFRLVERHLEDVDEVAVLRAARQPAPLELLL
jgi:hypothetical protein